MCYGIGKCGNECTVPIVVRFSFPVLKTDDISIVKKNDCVVCLLTGHGKSSILEIVLWCYMFRDKSTRNGKDLVYYVIISPLIPLMDKQVEGPLQERFICRIMQYHTKVRFQKFQIQTTQLFFFTILHIAVVN